jgi:thiamine biosynthesis lipoprotein
MTSPFAECRRVRPLLGTLVRVEARAASERGALAAVEAGFAAMAPVNIALNAHHPDSDLARIARARPDEAVPVLSCTWRVLRAARALAAASRGVFDPAVGGLLMGEQRLPNWGTARPGGCWRDLELPAPGMVRTRRPLRLDCGGIAKGHAIDLAVAALRRAGAVAGLVEAGGDLRVFGSPSATVWMRQPLNPASAHPVLALQDGASATSAPRHDAQAPWLALVDPRTGQARAPTIAVTVAARRALWADALTKVVGLSPSVAAPLLRRLGASALVVNASGRARLFPSPGAALAGWRWLEAAGRP